MTFTGVLFLIAGVLGLFWATVAAPIHAFVFALVSGKRRARVSPAPTRPLTLEILVAAHNEEAVIERTLESLAAAADRVAQSSGAVVSITVGCDHCTDSTIALVEKFSSRVSFPVKALVNPGARGKWNVLNFLIGQSGAEWVALVDAGSVWNAELLERAWPNVLDPSVIGVAPSYSPSKSGAMERLNWALEQSLKKLENQAGGPISVHGATVLYRRDTLNVALKALAKDCFQGVEWLNDDVVIPLTLRLQNPEARIVYFAEGAERGWVSDIGIRGELGVEYRRRKRMLMGNLQWVRFILARQWHVSPIVTAIASRRFFRMLWAYWVLFIALGVSLMIPVVGALGAAAAVILATRSSFVRRLSMAFVSGLQLPRYMREFTKNRGVLWL